MLWLSLALAHPLDDAMAKLERVQCLAPRTSAVRSHPGAEQVYAGVLNLAGKRVVGEERRYLYANPAWRALGGQRHGEDCVDVWTLTGEQVAVVECPRCTHALAVEGHLNVEKSTCRRRLTPNGNHFKTTYHLVVDGDKAIIQYPSGKVLGTGSFRDNVLTWVSEQTCTWF